MSWEKVHVQLVELQVEKAVSFTETSSLLERIINRQTIVSQTWVWQKFSWKWTEKACHFNKKKIQSIYWQWQIELIVNLEFWKIFFTIVTLTASPYLKLFLMGLMVIISNIIFKYYIKRPIQFGYIYKCIMFQNHACVEGLLKVQDRPANLELTRVQRVHWCDFRFHIATNL